MKQNAAVGKIDTNGNPRLAMELFIKAVVW
jgi:hypothetical protein